MPEATRARTAQRRTERQTMEDVIAAAAATLALAGAALSESHVAEMDENGAFSPEEPRVSYPDLTEHTCAVIDADGDGAVSADVLVAAEETGVLTAG